MKSRKNSIINTKFYIFVNIFKAHNYTDIIYLVGPEKKGKILSITHKSEKAEICNDRFKKNKIEYLFKRTY
jgi:hypothetical protein